MSELISWIDVDTLLLLFSMMILVAVTAETGIFDWLAVYAYKVAFDIIKISLQYYRQWSFTFTHSDNYFRISNHICISDLL